MAPAQRPVVRKATKNIPKTVATELCILTLNTPINTHNASDQSVVRLLGLPKLIRKMIWRAALLEASILPLSATGTKQPGLLLTCRGIREETVGIYYTENTFTLVVVDCNAEAVLPSLALQAKYFDSSSAKAAGVKHFNPQGRPHWQNFKEWCKLDWSRGIPRYRCSASQQEETRVLISSVLSSMCAIKAESWDEVEEILEAQVRPVLALRDPAWEVDWE